MNSIPLCIVLSIAMFAPLLPAQQSITPFQLDEKTRVTITDLRDTSGVAYTAYAEIAQFSPQVSLRLAAGEVAIRSRNGDVSQTLWDHPLTHQPVSEYVPVYQYNSAAFANPIVTFPFTVRAGDTLTFFRDFGFRFPMRNEDGSARTFAQDTAHFQLSDSMVFRVELIDASSEALLRSLESFTVPPCRDWQGFCMALSAEMLSRLQADDRHPYIHRTIADEELDGKRLRLRINPQYRNAIADDYSGRALYLRFTLNPRLSSMLAANWDRDMEEARHVYDKLVATLPLPKNGAQDHPGIAEKPAISLFPSLLSRSMPVLQLRDEDAAEGDAVTLLVSDINGRLLHQEARISRGEQSMVFLLPPEATEQGSALVAVRVRGTTTHTIVRFY